MALIWRGATFYVPHMLCVLYHFVVFRRLQVRGCTRAFCKTVSGSTAVCQRVCSTPMGESSKGDLNVAWLVSMRLKARRQSYDPTVYHLVCPVLAVRRHDGEAGGSRPDGGAAEQHRAARHHRPPTDVSQMRGVDVTVDYVMNGTSHRFE